MSKMSYMKKLLNGVEVVWKALGDEDFFETKSLLLSKSSKTLEGRSESRR
jgi:hypothetical protein